MWKTKIICIFAHFCQVWVNRKQVDFHICFLCNNLLQMCCLNQSTWGKWEVIPIHSWERRDILTVFSCNCGFSPLILCYSLSSDSFPKVSYNMECETLSVNFSYFVTLKLTCWPGTWMGLSSMFDSVISCMGDLENSDSSSYADLLNVGTFCLILEKMNSLVSPSMLLEKSLIIEKISRSRQHDTSFQNSTSTWKFKFYLWQWRLSTCFPWSNRFCLFIEKKKSLPNTHVWRTIACESVVHSS